MLETFCFLVSIACRLFQLTCDPRLARYFRMGPSGDSYIYHFYVQFLRNHKIGGVDKRCLISERPSAHPVLFESLWKYLPDYLILTKPWIPNFVTFFFGTAICFYMLTISEVGTGLVILGIALWLLQPDHFSTDYYRIHFVAFQPRYLGAFFGSILFLILSLESHNTLTSRMLECLLIYLMWNTSLFSRQVLLYVIPFWAVFASDYIILGQLVAVLALLCFFDHKGTFAQLNSQFKYYFWYFRNYPIAVRRGKIFRDLIASVFSHHITQLPCYLYLFWLSFLFLTNDSLPDLGRYGLNTEYLSATFLASLVVCIITSFRLFAFAGEGWRYLTFSSLLVFPLIVIIFIHENFFVIETLIICGLTFTYGLLFYAKNSSLIWQQEDLLDLFNNRQDEFHDAVWYTAPFNWSALLISRGFGRSGFILALGHQDEDIMKTYFSEYPFLKWDVEMLNSNKVSHILIERCWLGEIEKLGFCLGRYPILMENERFIVIKWI